MRRDLETDAIEELSINSLKLNLTYNEDSSSLFTIHDLMIKANSEIVITFGVRKMLT